MRTKHTRGPYDAVKDHIGPNGSIVIDTDHNTVNLHDGTTAGGMCIYRSVRLQGPKTAVQNNQVTYTIVNYDSFSTYAAAADNGTVTLDGASITYTAPGSGFSDRLIITRNGVGTVFNVVIDTPGLTGQAVELSKGPGERHQHTTTVIEGQMYVYGGRSVGTGGFLNDLWVYDPTVDTWTELTASPETRSSHSAAAINGKMYVFGGVGGTPVAYLNDLWAYDPATDGWSQLASGPPTLRDHSAVAINGLMYVFGGYDGSGRLNDLWVYDPATDGWTQLTSWITARDKHATAVLDGQMYVVGGFDGSPLREVRAYNPQTEQWTSKANLPVYQFNHSAVALYNKLYVVTQRGDTSVLEYDPQKDSWKYITSNMPQDDNRSAVAIGDAMYVFGGYDDDRLWRVT